MNTKRQYKRTVLDNGLTLVTEENHSFYSATIGIWVKCGSVNESETDNGISHFLEHMLFKGTPGRTALDISREVDSMGGEINAFTTTEATCYYMKVMASHIPSALSLLGDIFLNSLIDEDEIANEKEVVLQEIKMVEDTPDDLIFDLFNKTVWQNSPLSQPVLGTAKSVTSFDRQKLVRHMDSFYTGKNIIVAAAGSLKHEEILEQIKIMFSGIKAGEDSEVIKTSAPSSNIYVEKRKLEQAHLCLGIGGISCNSPRRYEAYILNTMLGSGMSSRLFQEIREKRGLAYSIYSFLSSYDDAGLTGIYAAFSADDISEVLKLIVAQLLSFKREAVEAEELHSAREQLKGNMVLGLENSEAIMQRLAHNEIYFRRDVPVEESIDNIEKVSSAGVKELACELFTADSLNLTVIGNVKKVKLDSQLEKMIVELG